MKGYFITGIDTEIGKTVASAALTQFLKADYWKPVQSGDLHHTDTDKVKSWVENSKTVFHQEGYRLHQPMSPHASAAADGVEIRLAEFKIPTTSNTLIVEGAGGLLVPLNDTETVIDLIAKIGLPVILVSKHRLGNINHTLLSIEALKNRNIKIHGILFNGEEITGTSSIIAKMSGVKILGTLPTLDQIDQKSISALANTFQPSDFQE